MSVSPRPSGAAQSPAGIPTPQQWLAADPDPASRAELEELLRAAGQGDEKAAAEVREAFGGTLVFGTAGIRSPMGPGPNRINSTTIAQTAAALASYLAQKCDRPQVAIGYDGRRNSRSYAETIAEVLAGTGARALLLPEPLPTPVLAHTTRLLGVDAGVMVTASHNPARDNGVKVYGEDGRQVVAPADKEIAALLRPDLPYSRVWRSTDYERLTFEAVDAYVASAAAVVLPSTPRNVASVYTALHGVGQRTLLLAVERAGFRVPDTVASQAAPDPDFPTLASPNPEDPRTLTLALRQAVERNADIVLATDPDADRLAVALPVPRGNSNQGDSRPPGTWVSLNGNEMGCLLAWWLLERGGYQGSMATSLVSSSMLAKMARAATVPCFTTLTGFKWISRAPDLGYGYEEAIGFCADPRSVPDKDGISAALLFLELTAFLASQRRSVFDVLDDLAVEHGVHATRQGHLPLNAASSTRRTLASLLASPPGKLGQHGVTGMVDLSLGHEGLPPTDGVLLTVSNGRVVIRPSGTERKLRYYLELERPVTRDGLARVRNELHSQLAQLDRVVRLLVSDHS